MKLAILLSVDIYSNIPNSDLPGCKNDTNLMHTLLSKLDKYDEILLLNQNQSAREIKKLLTDFMTKYKTSAINELFFYFTGHGLIDNSDFHYILSDFSFDKIKQTSLENSELDDLIRELNPQNTIKVVDACYSGMPYVKDIMYNHNNLEKAIKQINNCYFMFSSHNNETSKQRSISYFTKSFINAIISSPVGAIRYKDIIDFISDDFQNIDAQTPYFVAQGSHTHEFGLITENLLTNLSELYNSIITEDDFQNKDFLEGSLFNLITKDSLRYCSKEEMLANINQIKTYLESLSIKNTTLNTLYDLNIEFYSSYPERINILPVATYLAENPFYFSKGIYEEEACTEIVQVKKKPGAFEILSGILSSTNYEDKEITKYRNKLISMELTENVPFLSIEILFKPKTENLKHFSIFLTYAFSKTDIILFTHSSYYKELNWDSLELQHNNTWKNTSIPAKDFSKVKCFLNDLLNKSETNILEELTKQFSK